MSVVVAAAAASGSVADVNGSMDEVDGDLKADSVYLLQMMISCSFDADSVVVVVEVEVVAAMAMFVVVFVVVVASYTDLSLN